METAGHFFVYEDLVSSYRNNLEVQTRGFSAGHAWLESWVPDDEPLPSLLNLIEAAQIGGLDSLAISVAQETLGSLHAVSLSGLFSHLSTATVTADQTRWLINFSDLQKSALFSDVREYYRSSLRERHGYPRFANRPECLPNSAVHCFENDEGSFWLACGDQRERVEAAGFLPSEAAPPSLSAAMDYLCEIIVGIPLLEVREHAIVRLEYRLRDATRRSHVQGILLPQNADPLFGKVRGFLTGLLRGAGAFDLRETNFFDPGPSAAWKRLLPEQRETYCQAAVDEASLPLLGYPRGIRVVDAHRPYAVTVKFEGDAPVAVKRKAALALEKILRSKCDARLEVFCLEMKDASQLRRL